MNRLINKKGKSVVNVLTTKMSSRGQVVIPEELRREFGWNNGTSFSVVVYKGTVIMQPLVRPSEETLSQYDSVIKSLRGSLGGGVVADKQSGKTRAEIAAMEKGAWRKAMVKRHA